MVDFQMIYPSFIEIHDGFSSARKDMNTLILGAWGCRHTKGRFFSETDSTDIRYMIWTDGLGLEHE